MRKRRNRIRIMSAAMAVSLVMTNLGSTIAYAQEGFLEMNNRPNAASSEKWQEYTFSHWADELAVIYGVTPTGLALNLTPEAEQKLHEFEHACGLDKNSQGGPNGRSAA